MQMMSWDGAGDADNDDGDEDDVEDDFDDGDEDNVDYDVDDHHDIRCGITMIS